MLRPRSVPLLLAFGLALGCSGSEPEASDAGLVADAGQVADAGLEPDAGSPDAGPGEDAGAEPDAGRVDAGPGDAGEADAGTPDAGGPEPFGVISGACGELDTELTSPDPSTFDNAIDFAMGYTEADFDRLSEGGQEVLTTPNAGGSSEYSEVFAYEILHRCEGASLLLTENEVMYDPMMSKKTDLVVEIDGQRIGVSVTRAVGFPRDDPYPLMQAQALLTDKLSDIQVSSANVVPEQAWAKQILHVIAYGPQHAEALRMVEGSVDPAVRGDTILWISVTNGDDAFIYD